MLVLLWQGFKHSDGVTQRLDIESGTLSRTARMLIYLIVAEKGWRCFTADVMYAFMQAEDVRASGLELYAEPTKDM